MEEKLGEKLAEKQLRPGTFAIIYAIVRFVLAAFWVVRGWREGLKRLRLKCGKHFMRLLILLPLALRMQRHKHDCPKIERNKIGIEK